MAELLEELHSQRHPAPSQHPARDTQHSASTQAVTQLCPCPGAAEKGPDPRGSSHGLWLSPPCVAEDADGYQLTGRTRRDFVCVCGEVTWELQLFCCVCASPAYNLLPALGKDSCGHPLGTGQQEPRRGRRNHLGSSSRTKKEKKEF